MAPHYAIAAARQVTPDDKTCYSPAGVAETLSKLRVELDGLEASRFLPNGGERLEHVKRHVSNLIAAASNGTPPGAPELWTLSIAVDYVCDHHIGLLTAEIRQRVQREVAAKTRG